MRLRKLTVAGAMIALAGPALLGCSSSSGSGSSGAGTTITYWATNQGATLQQDQEVLAPQMAKFTQETGIKVNLQVLPWSDDDTKILAAIASGQGPDALNFGNTDAWTFGSTGALLPWTSSNLSKVGGSAKFIPNVLAAAGSAPYTSLPLYSQAYGLFYNKAMFQKAGLTPPTTWQELVSDAKKFTDPSTQTYGVALQGASVSENMHFAYIFARQNGSSPFNSKNQPTFTTAGNVNGLQQYLDLMKRGRQPIGSAGLDRHAANEFVRARQGSHDDVPEQRDRLIGEPRHVDQPIWRRADTGPKPAAAGWR